MDPLSAAGRGAVIAVGGVAVLVVAAGALLFAGGSARLVGREIGSLDALAPLRAQLQSVAAVDEAFDNLQESPTRDAAWREGLPFRKRVGPRRAARAGAAGPPAAATLN